MCDPPPPLQEFCIIALVGLLCDSYLQLLFFPTVLSIDMRRLEVSQTACLSLSLSLSVRLSVCLSVCLSPASSAVG